MRWCLKGARMTFSCTWQQTGCFLESTSLTFSRHQNICWNNILIILPSNFQEKVFLGDNGATTEFGACSCPGSSNFSYKLIKMVQCRQWGEQVAWQVLASELLVCSTSSTIHKIWGAMWKVCHLWLSSCAGGKAARNNCWGLHLRVRMQQTWFLGPGTAAAPAIRWLRFSELDMLLNCDSHRKFQVQNCPTTIL